jgi:hypothetical protein
MGPQKRYIHDRLILLLLSISAFLTIFGGLWTVLRLGSRNSGFIVQYRTNLGISAFKTGRASEVLNFAIFMVLVLALHTMVSVRAYRYGREYSVAVLGLGIFLLILAIVVSNALLVT